MNTLQALMTDQILEALDDALTEGRHQNIWLGLDDLGLEYDHDEITRKWLKESLMAADDHQFLEAYEYFVHVYEQF